MANSQVHRAQLAELLEELAFVRSLRQLEQVPSPLLQPVALAVVAIAAVPLFVPVRVAGWIGFTLIRPAG
ncbi:hypothetical protein [Nonomuraea jiangxiensis]|uniref:hypothetical protein n=1 Tax=Nonomuraea jiangxiensis TaxID=633440 RepID=UPI00115F9885|nr:hypothetical protein [Nonomuraea jiangxiensis]